MEWIGLEPGAEVGGYRIVAPLGSGGMGTVYRAVDADGVEVALKLLHPQVGLDPVARERLRREVESLQRLRHPAVARVLDAESDSTEAFVVTELVDGVTLDQQVAASGPLIGTEISDLGTQLRSALDAIHRVGVVHRDLKPSNVMLSADGPVLIDFGIAQLDDDRVTTVGLVAGTPGYLAPELLDGAEPTAASDWWGWAALLVFAATGRPPFGTGTTSVVLERVRAGAVDVAGLGQRTARALRSALAVDPGERGTPEQVLADLVLAAAGDDPPQPPDQQATTVLATDGEATTVLADGAGATAVLADGGTSVLPADAAAAGDDTARLAVPAPPADRAPPPVRTSVLHPPSTATQPVAAPAASTAVAPVVPATEVMAVEEPTTEFALPGDQAPERYPPEGGHGPDADDEGEGYLAPPAPHRIGTLLAQLVLVAAAAALAPGAALLALVVVLVVYRAVGTASNALHARRADRGVQRGDAARAAAATPWYLLRAVVAVLPSLVVGVSVMVVLTGMGWWLLSTGRLVVPAVGIGSPSVVGGTDAVAGNEPWVYSALLVVAMAAGVLSLWWGPASGTTRIGARRTVARVLPGLAGALVMTMLALLAVALMAYLVYRGNDVLWWPIPGAPEVPGAPTVA